MNEDAFVFLDLDDTILDFHAAEKIAIENTFISHGIEHGEDILSRYSEINIACWEMLERGEIEREKLMTERFRLLFEERGISASPVSVQNEYESRLSRGHFFMPGAVELLEALHGKYGLYMTSNGTKSVQEGRIKSAGIAKYYSGIFISEDIGFEKPDRRFFDHVFSSIEGFDRQRAVIIGDSLTSDILGGINAGIKTVWFSHRGKAPRDDIVPDYTVKSLSELPALLERIFN